MPCCSLALQRWDIGDQGPGAILSVTNIKVCSKRTPAPASDLPGWWCPKSGTRPFGTKISGRRRERATFQMTTRSRPCWVSSAPKGQPRRRRPRDRRRRPRRRAARPSGQEPKPRQSKRSTWKSVRRRGTGPNGRRLHWEDGKIAKDQEAGVDAREGGAARPPRQRLR
jgi:hypothetical protein